MLSMKKALYRLTTTEAYLDWNITCSDRPPPNAKEYFFENVDHKNNVTYS